MKKIAKREEFELIPNSYFKGKFTNTEKAMIHHLGWYVKKKTGKNLLETVKSITKTVSFRAWQYSEGVVEEDLFTQYYRQEDPDYTLNLGKVTNLTVGNFIIHTNKNGEYLGLTVDKKFSNIDGEDFVIYMQHLANTPFDDYEIEGFQVVFCDGFLKKNKNLQPVLEKLCND